MKKQYEVGKRYHNGKFIGWAIWLVHPACTKPCCPKTVAEFYGKNAKRNAEYCSVYLRHLGDVK
jgi:hypothetical protein